LIAMVAGRRTNNAMRPGGVHETPRFLMYVGVSGWLGGWVSGGWVSGGGSEVGWLGGWVAGCLGVWVAGWLGVWWLGVWWRV
jgi:hypothetical protein